MHMGIHQSGHQKGATLHRYPTFDQSRPMIASNNLCHTPATDDETCRPLLAMMPFTVEPVVDDHGEFARGIHFQAR